MFFWSFPKGLCPLPYVMFSTAAVPNVMYSSTPVSSGAPFPSAGPAGTLRWPSLVYCIKGWGLMTPRVKYHCSYICWMNTCEIQLKTLMLNKCCFVIILLLINRIPEDQDSISLVGTNKRFAYRQVGVREKGQNKTKWLTPFGWMHSWFLQLVTIHSFLFKSSSLQVFHVVSQISFSFLPSSSPSPPYCSLSTWFAPFPLFHLLPISAPPSHLCLFPPLHHSPDPEMNE